MSYNAGMAPFGCTAGIATSTTWNTALRNFKPTDDSVILLLGANFKLLASSNMFLNHTSVSGATYDVAVADDWTVAFQAMIVTRYNNQSATAMAVARKGSQFEVVISGTPFIIGISLVGVTQYDQDQLFLIAGIPRSQIYGKLESAQKRSRAVVIGISVAVTIVVAGIFVLVALPLLRLAHEMAQLTKLDFGTLESSGALDRRSLIWELRKVQRTFATMVRVRSLLSLQLSVFEGAFAGAIKRNRAMVRPSGGIASNPQNQSISKAGTAVTPSQAAMPMNG
ncbi:uncharacterized protein EV422DRAFT_371782 [Fimicolochytrium jonesii]|uniref:uncharacterized protein n=1 Tax=Fimicolochytrium jonesii TaxID=1396493 RepID=UPI0022FDC573|nr:uncharacterized protein EV422DRAFT_371782 [Fimicolochytrium jonesii]KAI8815535.1 hypothetical protein EV422DRAFT_371782 [Fimicolochytrium jonesii]